jgi:S1-C subfamily serine protease
MIRPYRICTALLGLGLGLAQYALTSSIAGQVATPEPTVHSSPVATGICSVVYPLDETSGTRGYQFSFHGNAFFVNREGYLLTAAHVLHTFRNGGQPYILVSPKEAPPRMLKVEVVAEDRAHDVAVLRATPNPFRGNYRVRTLPLRQDGLAKGQDVLVAALRPSRRRPHTFETELQDRSQARVMAFASTELEKGLGDAELFLFNHEVILGQSGAPVLSADGSGVLGFVEGQWLHPLASMVRDTQTGASSVGAAVPIRYAVAVLREREIAWEDTAR